MSEAQRRVPVTVLTGFLGAGKTTLLQHLLAQASGKMRLGVIVNDVGALNIDASLIKAQSQGQEGTLQALIELTDGCICCSIQDDLAAALTELASQRELDAILVECTGVAEPLSIVRLIHQNNRWGRSLLELIELSALIAVVDAPLFLSQWDRHLAVAESEQKDDTLTTLSAGAQRPLFGLLVEQVECCDMLVINKCDQVDDASQSRLRTVLRSLNATASIRQSTFATLPLEDIVGTQRFDMDVTLQGARWLRVLEHHDQQPESSGAPLSWSGRILEETRPESVPLPKNTTSLCEHHAHDEHHDHHDHAHVEEESAFARYGISAFVYEARAPFDREALFETLKQSKGILRAKGFVWIKQRLPHVGFLSVAGLCTDLTFVGSWWFERVRRQQSAFAELPEDVRRCWQDPHGDRRQELVVIGVGLDEAKLRASLDACLRPLAMKV